MRVYHRERLPDKLEVKLGAKVVLKNIDVKSKWVNGTLTTIESVLGECIFTRHTEGTFILIQSKLDSYSCYRNNHEATISIGSWLGSDSLQGARYRAKVSLCSNE